MKNNGFYLRQVYGNSWLLMGGTYPLDGSEKRYVHPIRLNSTGTYIWKQIENNINIQDIARNIQNDYGISYNEAYSDVSGFVEGLKKKGCLYDE